MLFLPSNHWECQNCWPAGRGGQQQVNGCTKFFVRHFPSWCWRGAVRVSEFSRIPCLESVISPYPISGCCPTESVFVSNPECCLGWGSSVATQKHILIVVHVSAMSLVPPEFRSKTSSDKVARNFFASRPVAQGKPQTNPHPQTDGSNMFHPDGSIPCALTLVHPFQLAHKICGIWEDDNKPSKERLPTIRHTFESIFSDQSCELQDPSSLKIYYRNFAFWAQSPTRLENLRQQKETLSCLMFLIVCR